MIVDANDICQGTLGGDERRQGLTHQVPIGQHGERMRSMAFFPRLFLLACAGPAHGCGENFPVAETTDGQPSADDRRAEVFFFDGLITPPPPGKTSKKGSTEYPQWVARVTETIDVHSAGDADTLDTVRIRLLWPFGCYLRVNRARHKSNDTYRRGQPSPEPVTGSDSNGRWNAGRPLIAVHYFSLGTGG